MTEAEVLGKLKEILIRDFKVAENKITPDATFRSSLGMDSLDAVDLVYLLCKTCGLPMNLHPFKELRTVQKVVDHLVAETQARSGQPK
jgi:acyl carrier protein